MSNGIRFNHTAHKRLWDIIASHPYWDKDEAMDMLLEECNYEYLNNGRPVTDNCFACEPAAALRVLHEYSIPRCASCPLVELRAVPCTANSSLYERWVAAKEDSASAFNVWSCSANKAEDGGHWDFPAALDAIMYARQIRDAHVTEEWCDYCD